MEGFPVVFHFARIRIRITYISIYSDEMSIYEYENAMWDRVGFEMCYGMCVCFLFPSSRSRSSVTATFANGFSVFCRFRIDLIKYG